MNARGKPRKREAPKSAFQPGNKFAFKSKAQLEEDALLPEPPSGTAITPLQLIGLTKLASQGVRANDMRFAVAMTQEVWNAYCAEHHEVHEAIAKGEAQMRNMVIATVLKKAKRGDFMSAALLANGLWGFRGEGAATSSSNVTVQIVSLPAADNSTPETIEGSVISDDDTDVPGLFIDAPPAPSHFNRKHNGEQRPDFASPAEQAPPAQASEPPTARERAALREFKHTVGLSTDRRSFDTEAAWRRFDKTR